MIKIIDNFFDKKMFLNIKNHVTTKLFFHPRFTGKDKKIYYGSRFVLHEDKKLLKIFTKQAEKKFKIKIKKLYFDSGIDMRNLNTFNPHSDEDVGKINILTMLSGPTAVTNGTVFYTKNELDIHVGFRENRSILFPSNWMHSTHASITPNLRRYTSTLFVSDYEE